MFRVPSSAGILYVLFDPLHPKKSIYEQLAVVVKDQLERRASEDGQLRRERVGPE